MNYKIRQLFEEHSYPNFPGIILKRKNTGEYESDTLEDHWQTFQEGWEEAVKECCRILQDQMDDHFAAEQLKEHFDL